MIENSPYHQVIKFIGRRENVRTAEIAQALGWRRRETSKRLSRMLVAGLLVKHGTNARDTYWSAGAYNDPTPPPTPGPKGGRKRIRYADRPMHAKFKHVIVKATSRPLPTNLGPRSVFELR